MAKDSFLHLFINSKASKTISSQCLIITYFVFFERAVFHCFIPFFLKRYDNKSDENIDKEKRKDDEKDNVKNAHLHSVTWHRPVSFVSRFNGIPKNTLKQNGSVNRKSIF